VEKSNNESMCFVSIEVLVKSFANGCFSSCAKLSAQVSDHRKPKVIADAKEKYMSHYEHEIHAQSDQHAYKSRNRFLFVR
jgi:hypothetical protein